VPKLSVNVDHVATVRQAREGQTRTPLPQPSSPSLRERTGSSSTCGKTGDISRPGPGTLAENSENQVEPGNGQF